ncbi:MAG: protein kinase [Oscillospiraceae bacterium]|nr:protein kinase [Oscillospiraceae bacterium]
MSEQRHVSPILDGFSLGESFAEHSGVEAFPAMHNDSDKRFIVKKISLPASQVQVDALLLAGVYPDADSVRAYYRDQAQSIVQEIQTLNALAEQRGFVPLQDHQVEPMVSGVGYEVYTLSRYRKTLQRHIRRNPMTHLGAVNLGIDLCAALAVCREAGWLYVALKPENIYLFGDQEYRIGDLGFVSMDSLKYASLPDRCRSVYTAPEVADAYASLNATMDTYALGLILYQVYNGGKLPFDNDAGRTAWLDKLAAGESIVPPAYADEEMAAIITKACAYDPADRWQTPAELGHAIISYMQRNGAEDIPIVPPAEPETAEEAPAEPETAAEASAETPELAEEVTAETPKLDEEVTAETPEAAEQMPAEAEESTEDADPVEETVEESGESPVPVEDDAEIFEESEATVEGTPTDPQDDSEQMEESVEESDPEPVIVEENAEEPAVPAEEVENIGENADWIDLMDAFLAEEEAQQVPDAEEPTLRELLGDEAYLSDADGVTADDVSAETADILSFAQELIEHEAPAPVVAPEPIDVPIPEPLPIEAEEESAPESDAETQTEADAAEPTETPNVPAEPKQSSGLWKKILGTAAALAAAAGLIYGAWYYYENVYLQTIDAMTWDGTATQVAVSVDTDMDPSKLLVICKDTYGNAVTGKLEDGIAVFDGLIPGSQYIITLEPVGFHKLLGTTSVTYSTPAETQIMHLTAVTGQEAGSAIVSFGVEGLDSEEWTLTCSAEGIDPVDIAFTGHTVTVPALEIGREYTFTLSAPEEIILVGETSIRHTASELVQASNLGMAEYADGVITVSWTAPEGAAVERWIVRCFDGGDYDQLQEVSGTTAAFTGVTEGGKYTVEVTAANMTLGIRAEITADRNNITGFTAVQNGSAIELSWNYAGTLPEGGWKIAWSADGGTEQLITAEENSAVLSPAVPGSVYTFTIQPPEENAQLTAATTLEIPAAGAFSANKLDSDTVIVEMFDVPSGSSWSYKNLQRAKEQDTFSPGGSLALLYTVTKPYTFDSAEFETVFVIRDAEGKLVSASARTRVWDDMWDNGYCTETVTALPAAAGEYTLSIYIANGLLAELPFTVK